MNFKPKTYKEIAGESRIADGIYPFEVIGAESKKSKNKNEMIEIKVRVFYDGDRFRIFTDYLMGAMAFKLIHFCEGTGLADKYLAGTLEARDCMHRTGRCKVGWKEDKTGEYLPKNVIRDYICPEKDPENKDVDVQDSQAQAEQEPAPDD